MKYPAFFRKLNGGLAFFCGCLIFLTGIFSVIEAIMRGLFSSPTIWTLNVSCYLLIWAIFLGSPYAFQTHGHVAVDLLRDAIDKIAHSEKIDGNCRLCRHTGIPFSAALPDTGWW